MSTFEDLNTPLFIEELKSVLKPTGSKPRPKTKAPERDDSDTSATESSDTSEHTSRGPE